MTKLWHRFLDLKNWFLQKYSNNTAQNLPAITVGDHRISPFRRTSITKPISENNICKILSVAIIIFGMKMMLKSSATEYFLNITQPDMLFS